MASSEGRLRFFNVLDLCYDIDLKSFRRVLLRPYAAAFLEHMRTSYRGFEPLGIPEEMLVLRRALTFGRRFYVVPQHVIPWNDDDPHPYFQSVREYIAEYGSIAPTEDWRITTFPRIGTIVAVSDVPDVITSLLARKAHVLIQRVTRPLDTREPDEVLSNASTFQVMEDPAAAYNNGETFAKLTLLMAQTVKFVVDPVRARLLINEVDADEQREAGGKIWLEGLQSGDGGPDSPRDRARSNYGRATRNRTE